MARGGRGKGRGRGGRDVRGVGDASDSGSARGFPAGAQGARTSFAQSGGKASTFGASKSGAGTTWQGAGGGSRGTKKTGRTELGNTTPVNIRQPGGDTTRVPGAHGGAGKLNIGAASGHGKGGVTAKPHELAPKGFGGGY